ncbi:hypothetical protein T484DRAFT_1848520, partial [Baffinella frigidus]
MGLARAQGGGQFANRNVARIWEEGDDLFANYMTSNRVAIEQDFIKLPEAPNRRSWGGSTPMDVNAFYGPNNNGLWIPAGILQ